MMVSFFLVFLRLTTTTLSAGGIQGIKDASVTKNITLEFRTRPEKRNHHKSSTITSPFYLSPKKTKKNKKKIRPNFFLLKFLLSSIYLSNLLFSAASAPFCHIAIANAFPTVCARIRVFVCEPCACVGR